jgi:hypothetical protein
MPILVGNKKKKKHYREAWDEFATHPFANAT